MIANTLILAIYIMYLNKEAFASFLCSKKDFILRKIINRVKFVYLFRLQCVI